METCMFSHMAVDSSHGRTRSFKNEKNTNRLQRGRHGIDRS